MIGIGIGVCATAIRQRRRDALVLLGPAGPGANITYSRASVATRISASGTIELLGPDTLRRDWGPTGTGPDGWLFEPAATNLVPDSAATVATLGANFATLTNLSLAAIGIFPGVLVASNGFEYGRANSSPVAVTSGTTYSVSVWYRPDSSPKARITIRDDVSGSQSVFGGPLGSFTQISGALGPIAQSGLVTFPDGSRRIDMTFTPNATGNIRFGWGPYSSVAGEATVLLGMQATVGTTASSYVETTSTAATRAADVAGVKGISGVHDVVVTYADGSIDTHVGVAVSDGYWPAFSQNRIVSVSLR
ncbi:MAG: hypothetical protein K0B00_09070 [Rhodobacteraceae bacterium]|nr:hypothetical protein [Paracoccaceae bacterium]